VGEGRVGRGKEKRKAKGKPTSFGIWGKKNQRKRRDQSGKISRTQREKGKKKIESGSGWVELDAEKKGKISLQQKPLGGESTGMALGGREEKKITQMDQLVGMCRHEGQTGR